MLKGKEKAGTLNKEFYQISDMIPYPVDSVLLREHLFQESGNLKVVLDPLTFDRIGGHKSLRTFGLGYINYHLQTDKEIYSCASPNLLRTHIYEHFTASFICYLTVLLIWLLFFTLDYQLILNFLQRFPIFGKQMSQGIQAEVVSRDDLEYHYVKA